MVYTTLAGGDALWVGEHEEFYVSTGDGAAWAIHAAFAVSDAVASAAATGGCDLYPATRSGTIYHSCATNDADIIKSIREE